MRSTGITREIDQLGRVVLPKELRGTQGLETGTPMEIFTGNEGEIILKKYERGCIFCNSMDDVTEFKGKHVCRKCRDEM